MVTHKDLAQYLLETGREEYVQALGELYCNPAFETFKDKVDRGVNSKSFSELLLSRSFKWSEAPQGYAYWNELYHALKREGK